MKYPIEVEEKRIVKRITLKQSILDMLNAFNVERGLIYTTKLLFYNPGKLVRFYLSEGRFKIVNAFRLLILTTAASLFVMYLAGIDDILLEFERGFNEGISDKAEGKDQPEFLSGLIQQLFFDWYNLFLWLAIPIYALFTFLFFRKSGYNYAEHLVIQSFYVCALNVITIVVFPLHWLIGEDAMAYSWMIVSLAYYFIFMIGVFKVNRILAIIKTAFLYVINNVIYMAILFLVLGIFVGYEMEVAKHENSAEAFSFTDQSWIEDRVEKSKKRLIDSEGGKKVWESIKAHGGLEKWFANGPIAFRFNYQPLDGGVQRDSYQIIDKWSVRAVHEVAGNRTLKYGWDGKNAWSYPDTADVGVNPRFWSATPYYFIGLPFVLADEGVLLEEIGPKEYKGVTYDLIKATFETGTGDAPDDFYIIYINPETKLIGGLRYVVSYPGFFPDGGHSPEKFMEILGLQEVNGISIPIGYNTYWYKKDSVAERITEIEVSEVEFKPKTPSDYFEIPEGAKIQKGL